MLQQSLFTDYPSLIRRAAVLAAIVVVVGVLGARMLAVLTPPTLVVEQPADLLSTSSRFVTISGRTEPGAHVTVNGSAFIPDASGAFSMDVILAPGANTIAIEARRRHSRAAQIIRRIQVSPASAPVA